MWSDNYSKVYFTPEEVARFIREDNEPAKPEKLKSHLRLATVDGKLV